MRLRCLTAVALLGAACFGTGCATTYFEVDDAVHFDDGNSRFVAFAQRKRGWILSGVEGVDVRFRMGDQEVARATTDERGFAKATVRVTGPTRTFEGRADVGDESFSDEARVFAWQRSRVIIACDVDSTISDTSLAALFFDPLDMTSTPIAGSPELLQALVRTHHVAYVTARPRFTLPKTRKWLEEHGYPAQPIITSLTLGDALKQTAYKTRTLKSLRKHLDNMRIGIGNTDIDADSYGDHQMLAILHQPEATPAQEGHVVRLQSWAQIGEFFAANAAVLSDPDRVSAAARGEEELILPSPDVAAE